MPEIEPLFTFIDLWTVSGPFIITGIVVIIYALITGIILKNLSRGLLKDLARVGVYVGLFITAYFALQVSSYIWGH
ncbi:hypothetical protein [Bacillus sp. FJAT-27445]|uniref:hypothetical protein n=1 Tax=Bacillus sp. FJAT-27445 TaxID=1679166 RepID=UPI0012E3CCE0|nr:hypothetical protein [Bacillus sp. FJAT-27445]